jgi:hypothetical protein
MRTLTNALVLALLAALGACTNNLNNLTPAQIQDKATGKWKVTEFVEDGKGETHHFNGYTFDFESSGTLTATYSGGTVNGTWSVIRDDGMEKMVIIISGTYALDEMIDDWVIAELTNNRMQLEDDSNTPTDYERLVLEKI